MNIRLMKLSISNQTCTYHELLTVVLIIGHHQVQEKREKDSSVERLTQKSMP
jgi:hypothetical protein